MKTVQDWEAEISFKLDRVAYWEKHGSILSKNKYADIFDNEKELRI